VAGGYWRPEWLVATGGRSGWWLLEAGVAGGYWTVGKSHPLRVCGVHPGKPLNQKK